jgi:competence protein ComEA
LALALLRVVLSGLSQRELFLPPEADGLPALIQEARQAQAEKPSQPRALGPGETIDPNRARAQDLARLPGIGTSVAQAIVSYREVGGAFTRAEDLLEVPGIGPATLARIKPLLDLSGGTPQELRRRRDPPRLLDVNRAGVEELQALPGIGPALARRIVESRAREGPFKGPEELLRVKGIGPATLNRFRALIQAGR